MLINALPPTFIPYLKQMQTLDEKVALFSVLSLPCPNSHSFLSRADSVDKGVRFSHLLTSSLDWDLRARLHFPAPFEHRIFQCSHSLGMAQDTGWTSPRLHRSSRHNQ